MGGGSALSWIGMESSCSRVFETFRTGTNAVKVLTESVGGDESDFADGLRGGGDGGRRGERGTDVDRDGGS